MFEMFKTAAAAFGAIAAGPFAYACIKWGAAGEKLDRLATSFDKYAGPTNGSGTTRSASPGSRLE